MSQKREGPGSGAHRKLPAVGSPKSLGAVLIEVVVFVPWPLFSSPHQLCPTPLPLLPNPPQCIVFFFLKGLTPFWQGTMASLTPQLWVMWVSDHCSLPDFFVWKKILIFFLTHFSPQLLPDPPICPTRVLALTNKEQSKKNKKCTKIETKIYQQKTNKMSKAKAKSNLRFKKDCKNTIEFVLCWPSTEHGPYSCGHVWLIYPESPLGKTDFSFAMAIHWKLLLGYGWELVSTSPLSAVALSALNLCRPWVCWASFCDFICYAYLLGVGNSDLNLELNRYSLKYLKCIVHEVEYIKKHFQRS